MASNVEFNDIFTVTSTPICLTSPGNCIYTWILEKLVNNIASPHFIVVCNTMNDAHEIGLFLTDNGVSHSIISGQSSDIDKVHVIGQFLNNELTSLVMDVNTYVTMDRIPQENIVLLNLWYTEANKELLVDKFYGDVEDGNDSTIYGFYSRDKIDGEFIAGSFEHHPVLKDLVSMVDDKSKTVDGYQFSVDFEDNYVDGLISIFSSSLQHHADEHRLELERLQADSEASSSSSGGDSSVGIVYDGDNYDLVEQHEVGGLSGEEDDELFMEE